MFNTKPKYIYIKNIYIQPTKNQKLSNSTNFLCSNKKIYSDYNAYINNNKDLNIYQNQINKTAIKSFYQNIYPQKDRYLLKENSNYLSSNNIYIKDNSKYNKQKNISSEKIVGPTISGRKKTQKNYQIINPFKERSNSENSFNCFNKTHSFFNKNGEKIYKLKSKQQNIINISTNDNNKISISCTNNNKNYNYRNDFSNKNNIISYSNNSCSSSINLKDKKYFYQEQNYKNGIRIKPDCKGENSIYYSTLQKEFDNPMNQTINDNIINNIEISSITSPITDKEVNYNAYDNKQNKRIRKYIFSDKKRKMRSRQNYKQDNNPFWKSTSIKDDVKNLKNDNNNYPDSKPLENIQNSPSILSSDINPSFKNLNFYLLKDNNNYDNLLDSTSNYFDSNPIFDNSNKEFSNNENNHIKEKDLFEQSAVIIQSIFRGYIAKNKFESLLFNYKDYSKGNEILEELFNSYFNKSIYIEKQKFLEYLKEKKNTIYLGNKDNHNYNSCKIFKFYNKPLPFSPCFESDNKSGKKGYLDLFLHKEIGERFNILKQSEDKEKELEKKHKEEIDGINNFMNKLIEENNKLKDINEKNKLNEIKFKELSSENKKKDNIINIITNDNQNLAKKLKFINEKYNKLEIKNEINVIIDLNKNNNKIDPYALSKELSHNYRNIYILYLFHKKNRFLLDVIRKYFYRYKNIIFDINSNNKLNNSLREEKLKFIINNKKNKGNRITYNSLVKLYYNSLLNNKEIKHLDNIKKEKILNLFKIKEKTQKLSIKWHFNKFYFKGIISELIEEKKESIKKEEQSKLKNLKLILASIENHKNKYNFLKVKICFDKWILLSKMLAMKAITDEKKRKKRQKQRTKKKIEKNKSANKYLLNSNSNTNIRFEKHNINLFNKDKEKEKDLFNYLEHSLTTDFSGGEINIDNKNDKILKATEKLNELFYKATLYYKILDNKNNNLNSSKVNNSIQNSEKNEKIINEKKNNNEKENDEEEADSGESSFGI